ncbi:MAG: hypothetical protein AAFU79_16860 [Myxococcota bacterium]
MPSKVNQQWPWPTSTGGVHGTHPEELKALQRLEKNPSAAPMPQVGPSRLLAPQDSSDALRFGEPGGDVETGAPTFVALSHVVLRRLRLKRARAGWRSFSAAVDTEPFEELPENRREQMRGMRRREDAMLDLIQRYNHLAETVYGQLIGDSKG